MKEKNKNLPVQNEESNPKEYFEKIIQAEAEIANDIILIEEEANRNLEKARKNLPHLRKSIIDNARALREKQINQGIKGFEEKSSKAILNAKKQSDVMKQKGEEYINQAVSEIFNFLISGKGDPK